jgi:hypothetical protein
MQTANKEEIRKAQLVIVTGLLLLYFLFKKAFLLNISLILGLIFLFIPLIGNWIVSLWSKLAEVLGWINSRILLSIVYFIFLVPVSIFFKLFNKNPLSLKKTPSSLYTERNYTYTSKDLENIW